MNLEQIIADLKLKRTTLQDIFAKADPTAEDLATAKTLGDEIAGLETKKSEMEAFIAQKEANEASLKALAVEQAKASARPNNLPAPQVSDNTTVTPAISFTANSRYKSTAYKSNEDALMAGHWLQAAYGQNQNSLAWLNDHAKKHVDNLGGSIRLKATNLAEGNDFYGGVLVPVEVNQAIVNLRENYGVFRANADVQVMARETKSVPKVDNNSSVFAVGEGSTFTQTDVQFREIQLIAKKFGAYFKYSSELSDDAIINLADTVANDLAASFEQKLDQCAFVGDGSSTYGGIIGLNYYHQWLTNANGGTWTTDATKAYCGGVYVASTSTWGNLTAADIWGVMGQVKSYPGFNPKFYCHKAFWAGVMQKLIYAAGGVTAADMVNGTRMQWGGVEVVHVESMPSSTAVSTIPLIYGDLKQGAMLGDRLSIQTDTQGTGADFLADTISVRAKARWDVKVHDAGNYNATATSRKTGAIATLAMKNSG